MKLVEYSSAKSKADATARMYVLAGLPPEPLGRGSKEKRSALEALARFLSIEEDLPSRKPDAGKVLAQRLGVDWDETCYSRGSTITTEGINRLVDAAVKAHLAIAGDVDTDDFITSVMNARMPERREPNKNAADQQEPIVSDDLTVIEANIAQSIAHLARTDQTPEGVKAAPTAFGTDTVRLGDGSWRERLSDVEGWLHLPRDLDKLAGPEGFDASLAEALGLELDGDSTSESLFIRLAERLDRAMALRDEFVDRMEDAAEGTETITTASQAWAKGWEETDEEEDAEDEESEGTPINAKADIWSIADFVQRAEDRELDLSPSYQRADVWPTGNAQLLIESILRGIPLPSVIILETDGDDTTNYEVVDGKQRLTSILRFIGKHPRATELVAAKAIEWGEPDAENLFQNDYPKFKKLWNQKQDEKLTSLVERRLYFPFALRRPDRGPLSPNGSLSDLRGKYYSEIREETVQVQTQSKKIKSVFEQTSAYKIPVILYTRVTPAQVHEVFSLYNKQGKHLNAEEIRNALFHELDLMKALLVTAGDSTDIETVAPFLVDVWDDLSSTAKTLDGYGFGEAGYKRTKILSWTAASLFLDDGIQGRSTTAHINALLKDIRGNKKDRLRKTDVVKDAMVMLDHAVDAHSVVDANEGWEPTFKNAQGGGKWQELQLVASLIGLSVASLIHGDDLFDVVEEASTDIAVASRGWTRSGSVQSKDQWEYLAKVVKELLDVLAIDPATAHESIATRFGRSGLLSLLNV